MTEFKRCALKGEKREREKRREKKRKKGEKKGINIVFFFVFVFYKSVRMFFHMCSGHFSKI